MAVNGVNSDRNYTEMLNGDKKTGKVYNAVFSNGEEDKLSINEFFDMMILQLTNQDFMNPVDDTQYLSQMAQFATMQEMMDLCQFSKQNYVMSMLGKEVTIGKNQIGGKTSNITGVVEKIAIENDEYKIYVDGKAYELNKVTQISAGGNKEVADKPDETENSSEGEDIKNETDDTIDTGTQADG